jgi:hypothetical protein
MRKAVLSLTQDYLYDGAYKDIINCAVVPDTFKRNRVHQKIFTARLFKI